MENSTTRQEFEQKTRWQKIIAHPAWVLVAAFGTYFCMYGFRKPYTASAYADASFFGIDYKILLIIAQTLGYVTAKWLGIKIVSQIKPQQRISGILGLIAFAELMLLLFGLVPRPWNICCLFLNGLPLGVVFGLVLGFVEGRNNTEFLIAGLCASFIVSDGVSKSIGSLLLGYGVSENWMPALAGAIFLIPTLIFTTMLAVTPPPTKADIKKRSARNPMDANDRWRFFLKYAPGLIAVTLVYLFVTLTRSIRADFAVELWTGLGYRKTPQLFTQSELIVSFGIIIVIGLAVLIKDNFKAFSFSLLISLAGFLILLLTVLGLNLGLDKFYFMVLAGLGVYMPYVAVHAIVFERLIAITRERANVGFLMYIVDSVGYTGYIILMFFRYLVPSTDSVLSIFINICVCMGITGVLAIAFSFIYFFNKLKVNGSRVTGVASTQSIGI
ncbi:DUF5690 family protein [Mucilaginibacter celer]|uniref:MFS transporter n=1 Tax=Mucilaginibacter celer TaxID=2305508 RepID=A0A494VL68_9SPHI|nr:DUF5690 family protein [Mucilaginibacter celer]AYL95957.1 hypothetical protein HYN43_011950 [Mucilaginibacter celer]